MVVYRSYRRGEVSRALHTSEYKFAHVIRHLAPFTILRHPPRNETEDSSPPYFLLHSRPHDAPSAPVTLRSKFQLDSKYRASQELLY